MTKDDDCYLFFAVGRREKKETKEGEKYRGRARDSHDINLTVQMTLEQ